MNTKITLTVLGVLSYCTLFIASESTKNTTSEQIRTPINFNYSPPTSKTAGSTKVGFLLIQSNFDKAFHQTEISPFKEFRTSLDADFEEIISSQGLTFRGPFVGYDEVTIGDKRNTNLVLETSIEMSIQHLTAKPWMPKYDYDFVTRSNQLKGYNYDGDISIGGKLKIVFSEVFSHEKLKVRNVEIPAQTVHVKSTYAANINNNELNYLDPGIFNPVNDALSKSYNSILSKCFNFFDDEEIKSLMPEANDLRTKNQK